MKNILFLTTVILLSCGGFSQSVHVVLDKTGSYKNLTIFLLRSGDVLNRKYVTLEEAMKSKTIVLHETGSVNELAVDNNSDDYVFIMAGDMVKGGKQDRTIGEDVVIAPKAKKVPLNSFCVEQSRWRQRGNENVSEFSSSAKMLGNKNLKIAARKEKSQNAVWNEVSSFQTNVGSNIGSDVKSRASASSLQLTLENENLKKTTEDYSKALLPIFTEEKDIAGMAFCVNGSISTIEWFGTVDLFDKLRNKLLESAINEAVFAYDSKTETVNSITATDIDDFIKESQKGEVTENTVIKGVSERKYETEKAITFMTFHTDASSTIPLHVSIYSTEGIKAETGMKYGGYQRLQRR